MTLAEPNLDQSKAREKAAGAGVWLRLTVPISILLVIATGCELLIDGLFRGDAPYFVAQTIGQDVVTLLVALPALVIGAVLAARGSGRARLVWLGVLVYLVYTYAIYAFHVRFNPLFLVYVALLGFSLYALVGGLATTDFDVIKARFTEGTPVRVASIFLAIVAATFYLLWMSEVVSALLSGEVPASVTDNGTPTNGVHVLDMAWILPSMVLAAVWLWRKRAIGYALAGVLLTFMTLLVTAIMAMVVSMSLYDQAVAFGQAAIFGSVAVMSMAMLIWYLRGFEGQSRAPSAAGAKSERSWTARDG
ncbi:MAG TPA: hypothetical protein VHM16_01865 [Rubrobacteraceae bacterium]|nr:hypothetical protein [Rubrobacteraceae bacterium]